MIFKQYNLNIITYEIPLGVYTTGDIIDYIDKISKGGIKILYDDITLKTKLLERSFIVSFDEKSFFNTIYVSHNIDITNLIALTLVKKL